MSPFHSGFIWAALKDEWISRTFRGTAPFGRTQTRSCKHTMRTAAIITAAAITLAGCTSIHDQAAQQCTEYGLTDDKQCILTVSENIRTRQAMALSAMSSRPIYQPQAPVR